MNRPDIESMDRRVKWLLLIVSLLTLVVLVRAAFVENVLADWKRLRASYADLLREKSTDEQERSVAAGFEIEIVQNVVPDLGRTDRCITCHGGVDDPRMADAPQPFTTHPGRYLEVHDPNKFGCTICHEGQGLALEIADAHGRVPHWDYPMLEARYTKSSCSKCHDEGQLMRPGGMLSSLDGPNSGSESAELLLRGRSLVDQQGCLGCHVLRGKGGNLGPELTHVGEKTRHDFDFSHLGVHEPRELSHWLRRHFVEPAAVSPGSVMPPVDSGVRDVDALTAYMLSLRSKEASRRVAPIAQDQPAQGRELYGRYCSSCHGRDGRATEVAEIRTPALNNVDALAVAGDDYYRSIIANGRSNSEMLAWKPGMGGLDLAEIDRIVSHIRSWESEGPRIADISARNGDARAGRAFYRGRCANCHGRRGEGGVGNALNSLTFLAVVSDRFLAETIVNGRPGTAMPSWKDLDAQTVSDILAYVRSWQPVAASFAEVQAEARGEGAALARIGRRLYAANCASCHASDGRGGIGPNLRTPDLLRVVDDRFLHRAITEGRPGTAMPAWAHLPARDVAAILHHLRGWQSGPAHRLPKLSRRGNYAVGQLHYQDACIGCHGDGGRGGVGPQLANSVLLSSASDEQLFRWIGRGRAGTAMKGFLSEEQGPAHLDEDQIIDVIAYLRHLGSMGSVAVLRTGVGNPTVGRDIFAGNCAGCHGNDGEGASGPQLNNPSFLDSASDGFLAATLVLGRTGTPMRSMVHGQEGLAQIDPDQVQDIIAHMRLWEFPASWRKPRSVAEMSRRAIDSGRAQWAVYCAGCHGPRGQGGRDGDGYYAPALNNPEFLQVASDGFLLATMARGRRGTPMPAYGDGTEGMLALRAENMMDIVSFIRSWQSSDSTTGALVP